MAQRNFLDAALEYASRGLRVFPIKELTKREQLLASWKVQATTDPITILDWWSKWPTANIGCALENHFVIDVDIGGVWRVEDTLTIKTPSGGVHYWFTGKGETTASKLARKVDTRGLSSTGKAGYVLLPPSYVVYDDGRPGGEYSVLVDKEPAPIPDDVAPKIAEARARRTGKAAKIVPGTLQHASAIRQSEDICAQELRAHGIPEIGENSDDRAYKLACRVRGRGLAEDEAVEMIIRLWAPAEFDENWIERKVRNGFVYGQNEPGSEYEPSADEKFGSLFMGDGGEGFVKGANVGKPLPPGLHVGGTPGKVQWLWKNWIPQGMITILAGDPSDGKTTLALDIAARITGGANCWPDGSAIPKGGVLLWCGEDEYNDVMLPRLLRMGADKSLCFHVNAVPGDVPGTWREFSPARDMAELEHMASFVPNMQMVLLDPIVRATGGKARDSNNNLDVREGLGPIKMFAQRQKAAVIGIHHHSKASENVKAVHKATGSLAWGAVARTQLSTVLADKETETYRLVRAKNNVGPAGDAFEYSKKVDGDVAYISWGDFMRGNANDLLKGTPVDSGGALREAIRFLRQELMHDGQPIPLGAPVKDVEDAARAFSISGASLKRAKDMLMHRGELHVYKTHCWHWRLRGANEAFQGRLGVDAAALDIGNLLD